MKKALLLIGVLFATECFAYQANQEPINSIKSLGLNPQFRVNGTDIVPKFYGPYMWTSAMDFNFGNQVLNIPIDWPISISFLGNWVSTLGSFSQSGSTDFSVTANSCVGAKYNTSCTIQVTFTPTQIGSQSGTIVIPASVCRTVAPHDCYSDSITFNLDGRSTEVLPKKECEKCGSKIGVDGQTMSETIPIVGSEFNLVYSSAYSQNYLSPYNSWGSVPAFNPNGMTVSVVHVFNENERKLYLGTGTSVSATAKIVTSGNRWVVSPDGTEVYVFSAGGKHLKTLYGLTGADKYTFSYGPSNKLSQIVDAFGNTTLFSVDGSGDLSQIEAPRGQVTLVTLTAGPTKLISALENPYGEKYEFTYKTGTSLMETFKKPGGQTSTFTYDSNGRLNKDLGYGGNFWDLSKDMGAPYTPITLTSKMGRVETINTNSSAFDFYERWEVLPSGAQRYYYENYLANHSEEWFWGRVTTRETSADERFGDRLQRLALLKTKLGTVESSTTYSQSIAYGVGVTPDFFNYDSITKVASTSGRLVTSVYNASTKTTTITSDEGATSSSTIDSYERPVGFQVGSDTAWTLTYGLNGRLDEIVQGTHNKLTYSYNSDGYVSKIANVRNEETSFTYDLAGRISQVTLPDTRVIAYSYDSNGNVTGVTPPSKPQHLFTFNNFELFGSYEPPSIGVGISKNTTYTYNDDKQLTQISRPDGQTVDYVYDSTKEHLTKITTPGGDYNYSYNSTSQKLEKIESPYGLYSGLSYYGDIVSGNTQQRTSDNFLFGLMYYTYDADHRVASRISRGNATTPVYTINYTYNDDDKVVTAGNLSLTYSYPSGRLSSTVIGRISDSYSYDSYGDLITYTAVDTPTGGSPTTLYTYTLTRDLDGRITQKAETIQGVSSTYEYFYDSAGRLTSVKKNGTVTDSFTYDSNGNRTSGIIQGSAFSATYDDQDRILTYGSRTYNYNNNGDLSRIQWNVTDKTDFVYDVLGNLKQVTLPTGTVLTYSMDGLNNRVYKTAAGSYNYRYLYDGQKRVVAHISGANALTKEFIYASRQTVPDYMITGGNKFRIISDHLGSPRLVVRTDSGVVVQRIDYNTLGLVTSDSSPGFQPYAFAGGIHDTHTLLVKFGARDYDPKATGRWTTKDPIGFDGGDVNLYGYVLNDPINFVDPSGLMGMPLPRLPEGGGEKAPSEADSDCKKNKPNPKFRIRILPGYDPGGVRGSFF